MMKNVIVLYSILAIWVVLVMLKLTDLAVISWGLVMAPLWIPIVVAVSLGIVSLIVYFFSEKSI